MPERFTVECPGCGDEKGSYSTEMIHAGRSCDCGTDFRVNLQEQTAEEIEDDDGDPRRNGHQ